MVRGTKGRILELSKGGKGVEGDEILMFVIRTLVSTGYLHLVEYG